MPPSLPSHHLCQRALLGVLTVFSAVALQGQMLQFDILHGNEKVGSIAASRTEKAERTAYVMTSYSVFNLIWKQEVRSFVTALYHGGQLHSCSSNMQVNGSMRDSSDMRAAAPLNACYVHPNERFDHSGAVTWTTSRMYFEEPLDQAMIFVESVLRYCPLVRTGSGTYTLQLPQGRVNHYTYSAGLLKEIRVDRTWFDLVFRRV